MSCRGFCDLNVPYDGSDPLPSVQNWYKSLYRTIALNRVIDLSDINDQKKKRKGEKSEIVVPEPPDIKLPYELQGKITVLNRLTIKLSEISQFPKLIQTKGSILRKYDLIAVTPLDQSCIQQVCKLNDLDIISVDCVTKPGWKFTRKLYNMAVEQNKCFEICYSPALRDSSTLKNTIFMSHEFYAVGKAKNLVITSGASDISLLRSPYEVIHLSLIFGLGENKARQTISANPLAVVSRALKRRQGKSCIAVSVTA